MQKKKKKRGAGDIRIEKNESKEGRKQVKGDDREMYKRVGLAKLLEV